MRVIGPNGDQLGIKPIPQALALARQLELDLVEVADKANPPVVRIMDYGKYKYEAAQRAKESRKKASNVVVKEMKYRPKIGSGDFDTKTRKVEKFLLEGHKVKITIMFRGREVLRPELGRRILDDIAVRVEDYAKVEVYPRLDGRNMTMVLGPEGKKGKGGGGGGSGRKRPPRSAGTEGAASGSDPRVEVAANDKSADSQASGSAAPATEAASNESAS